MNRSMVLSSARLAGSVTRYHTWPTLQTQTVADHTFQCMRIWWQIWGAIPPEVSTYLLWHDLGEIAVGDLPFPVKSNNGELRMLIEEQEHAAVNAMGGVLPSLDMQHKWRAKCCDLIEMQEFGMMEYNLGNKYAEPIIVDTTAKIAEVQRQLSPKDVNLIVTYLANRGWTGFNANYTS